MMAKAILNDKQNQKIKINLKINYASLIFQHIITQDL